MHKRPGIHKPARNTTDGAEYNGWRRIQRTVQNRAAGAECTHDAKSPESKNRSAQPATVHPDSKPPDRRELLRPAAAQGLVELHQGEVLVPHGVAHPDLGIEITTLGVQHVDIIDAAAAVLQLCQLDVLAGRIAQVDLQGRGRRRGSGLSLIHI